MAVVRLQHGNDWTPPVSRIPLELLALVFAHVESKCLVLTVPNVCHTWRNVCREMYVGASLSCFRLRTHATTQRAQHKCTRATHTHVHTTDDVLMWSHLVSVCDATQV